MLLLKSPGQAQAWYDAGRNLFTVAPVLVGPITLFYDAPFGRFSSATESIFTVDGIKSWILMELVSPLAFAYAFLNSPLSPSAFGSSPPLSLSHPPTFLAVLFLTHYANRALISPLRTPSRSKSSLIIPIAGAGFNIINGPLLGAYLSSPAARAHTAGAFGSARFWAGIALWAAGLAGNIAHDEILLNIRRRRQAQTNNTKEGGKEHYAVPHGLLFRLVSFPNYFCEWAEWLGFALAAAPLPSFASGSALLASISPPWIFLLAEFFTMLPRAWRGHKWYHSKFPDYPKERKVVIPYLL